jgi:hypothetical protein
MIVISSIAKNASILRTDAVSSIVTSRRNNKQGCDVVSAPTFSTGWYWGFVSVEFASFSLGYNEWNGIFNRLFKVVHAFVAECRSAHCEYRHRHIVSDSF